MLESLVDKVAGLKVCKFVEKRAQHRYFPMNIAKLLRAAFFIEYLRLLLLKTFDFLLFSGVGGRGVEIDHWREMG